jgi:acyl dehydratase
VNQGGLNVGYVMQAVTNWAGSGASLREMRVRFHGTVRAGDTVRAGGEVIDVRQESQGGLRVALRVWLRGSDGAELLSGTAVAELVPTDRRERD